MMTDVLGAQHLAENRQRIERPHPEF
jgi:hypothetical protein